jgi:hypothetical protein
MSPTPEQEPVDHLKKARQWLDGDKYGSVTGANATQVTMHALLSIATDVRKLVDGRRTLSDEEKDRLVRQTQEIVDLYPKPVPYGPAE